VLDLLRDGLGQEVKALCHITGGGYPDNIPRILPAGLGAVIDLAALPMPPVFRWLAETGRLRESEMLRTFNCGIGFVLITSEAFAEPIVSFLDCFGLSPRLIGRCFGPVTGDRVQYAGKLTI
jgi:phosphoribosylformylglycinamidine cyclo-ligase